MVPNIYVIYNTYIDNINTYNMWFNLKVGNKLLLHKLKFSILSRAILIGEIIPHKYTNLLKYYFATASFQHGDDLQTTKYTIKPTKKDLPNIVWF